MSRIRYNHRKIILWAFFCLITLVFTAFAVYAKKENNPKPKYENRMAFVVRAVDGDTIVLDDGQKVRYIGIDTPESKHPHKPVQPFAYDVAEFNRKLVEAKMVYLVFDAEGTDKYGRLLCYVFVGDVFVNARLVKEGLAREKAYPPNVKFRPLFISLEREAKQEGKGIWSSKNQ